MASAETTESPNRRPSTYMRRQRSSHASVNRKRVEARIAGGDVPSESRRFGFRGGPDAENSLLVVTRVQQ